MKKLAKQDGPGSLHMCFGSMQLCSYLHALNDLEAIGAIFVGRKAITIRTRPRCSDAWGHDPVAYVDLISNRRRVSLARIGSGPTLDV